ncbi:MAG: hypothetical protein KBC66_04640 [Kiritimatiellae bacterium]|nr:hypothetical protein [Kiritimatiellia bacterium]NLD88917.1 hypothetical protein [Lentisphaerota bacterium]HPC19737.1 alpha-amylase family glycosyl hydrolase [Kiritimatiellia bacterium]HQQ60102.1 alpha-amylase family glycosyl hydrolase [Kiritimatiellia bacterium]
MRSKHFTGRGFRAGLVGLMIAGAWPSVSSGEAMLQYFNTSWREITDKMPELAEAGYSSIWIPPPTKGSGGLSVGYDLCDPFDLGGRYQRGTVTTRYGTEAELLNMIETAHRFGIRVYLDTIMNHRAFDIPAYNETTPVDVYPGMVPEDFHLRRTEDGFYRKWDNCRDWNDAWQVLHLGLSDLVDIAHETPNQNHGLSEGSTNPKPAFVRHPHHPEFYDRMPNTNMPPEYSDPWDWSSGTDKNVYVGFGTNNGITTNMIAAYPGFFTEDVGAYLCRNARWLMAKTRADGLRLDAVKHVPDYFFGQMSGEDKDSSNHGFCGNAQWQFNMTRGYSDWDNHRDSNFETELPRDDALLFGEHLGNTPAYGGYWDAGMRLVDNDLRSQLNDRLGSMWNGLEGFDNPGWGGFAPGLGVMHAQSHDNDYAARRELQHAFYFLRQGIGLIYSDGNYHAETLGESGGAFPRWANTAFLGQWGDGRVPNLLYCHEHFARGYQRGVWSDGDYVAWERLDWRQGGDTGPQHVTMLVMLNDNYDSGQARDIVGNISFPKISGSGDAYLYNYSWYGGGFYKYASQLWDVTVPPGGYFIFSWKNPDPAPTWTEFGGQPVTILQNGQPVGTVRVVRKDGPDGDANFNPYNLADTNDADFAYAIDLPRVTSATNLGFVVRADGSTANVLVKLDGGMDLNGANHSGGDPRDNPPALSDDILLGYEQAGFIKRIWAEKFSASDSNRCKIGSAGAETYCATIGVARFTINNSIASNDWNSSYKESSWIFHDPNGVQDGPRAGYTQFWPAVASAANQTLYIAVKTPKNPGNELWFYYTTNGVAWPEGAGGTPGNPDTRVIEASWVGDGDGATDWWEVMVPPMPAGTVFRYKASVFNAQDGEENDWYTVWPGSAEEITLKHKMLTEFQIANFNAAIVQYRPHADYGETRTGLKDGFHLVSARAFVNRADGAAIYNTFKQTFYLDAETPQGIIQWPANNGDILSGTEYGVVVRTDPTVREVWYRIEDDDPTNDDSATSKSNGNGNVYAAWQKAYSVTPEDMSQTHPQAWRFNYANLPTNGNATIRVRLREWSSADKTAWTNAGLSQAQGHYRELTRNVQPRGDASRLYFDWPPQDGDYVEAGWEIRVKYSSRFAADLNDEEALALFTIKLNSAENGGDPANGVVLSHDDINISHQWDWPNENTIAFTMPNVYNGNPDWLHSFEITGVRGTTIRATRKVRTMGELRPSIIVTEPPELGSDGKLHVIILPDVPPAVLATNPALRETRIRLSTGTNAVETGISFTSPAGYAGEVGAAGTTNIGSTLYWDWTWSNLTAGTYRFTAWVRDAEGQTNTASRTARLQLLQVVDMTTTNDLDHDDDGLEDSWETTPTPLPSTTSEGWNNGDVHVHYAFGQSLPESPDSDGDGLPDGLEVGWRTPGTHALTNTDTNADGWPNFRGDLDPPFYNTLDNHTDGGNSCTVPGVDSRSKGGDRSRRVQGSTTDPSNPDSDYDGLPDGVEDANRNGWVDGDGSPLGPNDDECSRPSWPTGIWTPAWTETDPNNPDSDGDGLSDGYGEDKNFNGWIDGDSNSNRVWNAGELWLETDPINPDTDGDGLPDGWEVRYGLNPWDSGVIGHTNMRTGEIILVTEHGAAGDPDGDGFSNLVELQNGTNPREFDDPSQPPPPGSITVGRGPVLGVVNGVTNYQEFTDWTLDDLIALDPYNDGGTQAVDIFRRWDGFDSSRDMVAFYMRDGGAANGKLYFRIDFQDLQANAEDGRLDFYVVIDFNSPGVGEAALPDEVDGRTDMKWEAVAAVYDSQNGRLYVDSNPANNTLTEADSLTAAGVVEAPGGFKGAYFNSELDAVEFAIDRAALVNAGWNGNANTLNFQVFTTKDGTCNTCVGGKAGEGDIGYRIDTTDIIRNTWLCSDYWRDQDYIIQNPVLTQWIGRNADNDMGKSAKIAMLAHGNQALQPGSVIHDIVDNGQGAGYHRPIQSHGMYGAPLNLHVTPTLASALEWAPVRTNAPAARSGAALNARIRELVASNIVSLMASTYADHIVPYFTPAFNRNNTELATDTLNRIYGAGINSNSIFWPPERVLDASAFAMITNLGFRYTLVDQSTHMFNWFGRTVALGDDGYRINRINQVNSFVINNAADGYRFVNHDGGIALPMRELFSRRSRAWRQDQVSTIFCMWEEFGTRALADAYDRNLRWLANHPWTQLVALEDIAAGDVPLPSGQSWEPIDRGDTAGAKQSHDWINHANNENYDNWYNGSSRHEGLRDRKFRLRPGVTNATAYGRVGVSGLASQAWARVAALAHPDVQRLAGEVLHASVFETAFHNESNHDLTRWSFGGYINPASDSQTLVDFARIAQNQTRMAAIYTWVDGWAATAGDLSATATASLDLDLDGENEYVLYNRHVAAVFERIGGRMIVAWLRSSDGRVRQMIGNLASYAGSETEEEGTANISVSGGTTNVVARRTSALKDWWANTNLYVNQLYTLTTNGVTGGWQLASADSKIVKTVTLAPDAAAFAVQYAINPTLNGGKLYVRHGFSPDLSNLLVTGQDGLVDTLTATGGVVALSTPEGVAGIELAVSQGVVNLAATDDDGAGFASVPMRNQAQTRQVEIVGTNTLSFSIGFFAADSENHPPEIGFAPPGPYTNAVGTTNAFLVTATDPDENPVELASGPLPFTATFNPATGAFAWWVTNMGSAGTTNTVQFTANDGTVIVTNTATIVVPWDANGNDIPDDWEFKYFDGDLTQPKMGDWDDDHFPNFYEWWASTDPDAPGSYIGWVESYEVPEGMKLISLAVPNGIYHIEGNDNQLPDPDSWQYLATVTNDLDETVEWIDPDYPANAVRHYRIKIPRHVP